MNDVSNISETDLSPVYLFSLIKDINGKVEALEKSAAKNSRNIMDIQEEYPLLPPESDDLALAVKKKGVEVMGGKKSNAYKDIALRRKVYSDIYYTIKREFGLINEKGYQMSYKKLRRKHYKAALQQVRDYVLPAALESEIESLNDIDMDD